MADYNNANDKLVTTELFGQTKWNNDDKLKNRRFSMGYANDMIYFQIAKPTNDSNGKFSERFGVYIRKPFMETAIAQMAKIAMNRLLAYYGKGEDPVGDVPVFHNTDSIATATRTVQFNVYKKENRVVVVITLGKRENKDTKDWTREHFYVPGGSILFTKKDNGPRDLSLDIPYTLFSTIYGLMISSADRTNTTRDNHFKRWLSETKEESEESSSNNESDDTDEIPF